MVPGRPGARGAGAGWGRRGLPAGAAGPRLPTAGLWPAENQRLSPGKAGRPALRSRPGESSLKDTGQCRGDHSRAPHPRHGPRPPRAPAPLPWFQGCDGSRGLRSGSGHPRGSDSGEPWVGPEHPTPERLVLLGTPLENHVSRPRGLRSRLARLRSGGSQLPLCSRRPFLEPRGRQRGMWPLSFGWPGVAPAQGGSACRVQGPLGTFCSFRGTGPLPKPPPTSPRAVT